MSVATLSRAAWSLVVTAAAVVTMAPSGALACNSEASCARYLVCPPQYDAVKQGSGQYCKRAVPAATKNPTCGSKNLANDWKWDAGDKECYRRRNNGDRVSSTDNIECRDGYRYKASSGKCERPGGTYYSEPTLK